MTDQEKNTIENILLMPIVCDKGYRGIQAKDGIIYSGQLYYGAADADMSDFTIGFYEIIYQEILYDSILDSSGYLNNQEFAGDTMNSFNTLANMVPEAGRKRSERKPISEWPMWLQEYHSAYRCLANFWVLPSSVGRTVRGKYNKAINPYRDFMDRFLQGISADYSGFVSEFPQFTKRIPEFKTFLDFHMISTAYCSPDNTIQSFSYSDVKSVIEGAEKAIKQRATAIAHSQYARELLQYFRKLEICD